MDGFTLPAFGEQDCFYNRENKDSQVWMIENTTARTFREYQRLFERQGYGIRETYETEVRRFCALSKGSVGVFLNYYPQTCQLSIVMEDNCRYFLYSDTPGAFFAQPQITQVTLVDFGLSYVIRLSDGRFIVMDGGRNLEPDRQQLYNCLKKQSHWEIPVIAAWIMTHPHSDHFHCFLGFMDQFADEVKIQKFLFLFPEADDVSHYPKLVQKESGKAELSGIVNIPLMWERIKRTNAPVYTPHTGQRYHIGDAVCEILSSMDDTIHVSNNINATSLVIRMELGGQVILWTADASFEYAKLPQRYGTWLAADILQVPHHGFQCGDADAEIAGYRLIQPKICLLPVDDYCAYTYFCTYRKGTHHLMRYQGIQELITGSRQRTLVLPYTAQPNAMQIVDRDYFRGRENCGAYAWIFTDLSTDLESDFVFSLLNTTVSEAKVRIQLYFEGEGQVVEGISLTLPHESLKRIHILGEDVNTDFMFYNPNSLKEKGIPENTVFGIRFRSDVPIVVSHKDHKEAYHSASGG